MDTTTWAVWVRVSGGVTGTREAWLKARDGSVQTFPTEADAKAEAADYRKRMNGPHSTAAFGAQARPYDGW